MGTVTIEDVGLLNNGQPPGGLRRNLVENGYPLRPSRTPNAAPDGGIPFALRGPEIPLDCRPVPYETEILGPRRPANGRVVTNCRRRAEKPQAREHDFSFIKKAAQNCAALSIVTV